MVRITLGKSCVGYLHMSVEGNIALLPSSCPGACGFVEEVEARSRAGGIHDGARRLSYPPAYSSVSLMIFSLAMHLLATNK